MEGTNRDVEVCDICGREFPIEDLFEGVCTDCEIMDYEDKEDQEERD